MRFLLGLAAALGALLLTAAPASAHASLVSVAPATGSTVTAAPTRVTVTFDENIRTPSTIIVTGPSGRVDHGATSVVDNKVSVAVRLQPVGHDVGRYRVAYRVVSADGHPVSGEAAFQYRPPGVAAVSTPASSDPSAPAGHHATWWWVGGIVVVLALAAALLRPRRRTRGAA